MMPLSLIDILPLIDEDEDCVQFCYAHNVLQVNRSNCPRCNRPLKLYGDNSRPDGQRFRCSNRRRGRQGCSYSVSSRKGSWFDSIKLTLQQAILIPYFWTYKYNQLQLRHELHIGSQHTSVDWYNFVREVCAQILIADTTPIGGPGITVEIDESKFAGRRKYNRGQIRQEVWVFGGIESRDKKNVFG